VQAVAFYVLIECICWQKKISELIKMHGKTTIKKTIILYYKKSNIFVYYKSGRHTNFRTSVTRTWGLLKNSHISMAAIYIPNDLVTLCHYFTISELSVRYCNILFVLERGKFVQNQCNMSTHSRFCCPARWCKVCPKRHWSMSRCFMTHAIILWNPGADSLCRCGA
jgi:hypothetical protein